LPLLGFAGELVNYPHYYFATSRDEMAKFVPVGVKRVLEIGCGSGGFRSHVPTAVEYWGIEYEPGPATDAATRLTQVLHGKVEDRLAEVPRGYFDLIVCNDVIEHLEDPRGFLADIQRVMAPDAKLVGSIPNVRLLTNLYRLLVRRDWEYVDSGVLDYTHLHFFTQKSLRRELTRAGLVVETLEGINPLGHDSGTLKRLLGLVASWVVGADSRFVQLAFVARRP
jgi:SAM-dependent methyltransferase